MPMKIEIGQHHEIPCDGMREPQLLRLTNGHLLLTFHTQADMHFSLRKALRSTDNGKTWQPDKPRTHREQAITNDNGPLVLAYDIYTFEKEPGTYIGSYFRSEDGGVTFSGPHTTTVHINRVMNVDYPTPEHIPPDDHPLKKFYQPLPDYYKPTVQNASRRKGFSFWRYIVKQNGRWLAPMQGKFHGDNFYRTVLVASDDQGKTWHFQNTIATFEDGTPGDGFCEPVIQVLPDNSLLCIMRRGGGLPLAQCRSHDNGQSWTKPQMLAAHGVDPDLCLMSNGILACTYGRPGLHIMFSPDGHGHSWGFHTPIGDWRSSTYMGIAEINPGELLLIYDKTQDLPGAGRDPKHCKICSTTVRVIP